MNAFLSKAQPKQAALFVSDLHLQPDMPQTAQAFFDFLQTHARHAMQLYLLGDIFEAWAGDDDRHDAFHARVVALLHAVSQSGVQLFWMAGNRDFLVGEQFARAIGLVLLPDPFSIVIANQRLVLTHGDMLCTDDTAYMQFRAKVRATEWQSAFLALPLEERKKIITELRMGSRAAQKNKSYDIMDVNRDAVAALFASSHATHMIHGHTHRPLCHVYETKGVKQYRHVLSDWDLEGDMVRGDWLAMTQEGVICRYGVAEGEIRIE